MKKLSSLILFSIFALASLNTVAQTPVPAPQPAPQQTVQPADENDVVRISTNLIQVDAVVTDKRGHVVTNLKPEDFEIFVNGKPQPITNFSFVTVEPQPTEQPVAASKPLVDSKTTNRNIPPAPPVRLRPEQVQRTIALVVDDLTLSLESSHNAREALKKFVAEQMQPGDLVAIVRVGSGTGALQQFTSDKQQLYAAIEGIKYNLLVGRISAVESIRNGIVQTVGCGSTPDKGEVPGIVKFGKVENLRDDFLVSASLKATNYIVQGMRDLPGRKAVMFLSEGFKLSCGDDDDDANNSVRQAIKRLVDSSNRSGVVIYTMDARALQTVDLKASDDINKDPKAGGKGSLYTTMDGSAMIAARESRRKDIVRTQEGLISLAEQAGGFAIYDTNDLSGGIRKALDDQKSYYLIGYQPDASTFDAAKNRFNQLTVKVKASGLKVRYRSGFFGIKDEEIKAAANTPQQKIMKALASPFTASDISLRLTPLFGNDAKAGSFVRSLVHISTKDLTFTDKPNGLHEAVINIVAYTFGDTGSIIDFVGETHTISLPDKLYKRALSSGLVYSLNVPIKNAGAYQLRVAVRDGKSERVGSASQFINVPDIRKDRLTLSGIALSSYDPKEEKNRTNDAGKQSTVETSGDTTLTQAALRRFRAGHVLRFAYAIYNAKSDKRTRQPQLTTQVKLYHDGAEIYAGKETPYEANGQPDLERLMAEGSLQLGGLQAGEYVLQITATDILAKDKYRTTTSWIDFEIVK
jgi:VWFA-related protein